ncbi:MAG: ATP phosphoribosyltransferase, partial [Chloroflexota bacterium]
GLQGPSITPVYPKATGEKHWFAATIIVPTKQMLPAVEYLRSIGGTQTTAQPTKFVFFEEAPAYRKLLDKLGI